MNAFSSFKRGNPCPICESSSGKCRELDELILCMTFTHEVTVPDYKFIGLTKDQTWGQWVQDNQREWSDQQRQHWQQEQQAKREQRLQAEQERRAAAMPAKKRDLYYRSIFDKPSLNPNDRADLKRRDFTDEQIEQAGFKSVQRGQKLDQALPHTLPGVNLDGRSLNIPSDGYLCPIVDVDGFIVSYQIRLRKPEGGRFRWGTSATKNRPNGATPHLPNGELPLAVFRPSKVVSQPEIALVEGTGAKPFLTCERLGMVTVGAAGGQFAASPETLRRTLEKLGSKTVVLYPDAGAVKNPNVMRKYRAAWELMQQWGYSFKIAWWEQVEKADGDIDEIADFGAIKILSVEEFETIACQRGKAKQSDIAPQRYRERQQLLQSIKAAYGKRAWRYFKRFNKLPLEAKPIKPPPTECLEIVRYNPYRDVRYSIEVTPETVPDPAEWIQKGNPKMVYEECHRKGIIKRLIELGYKHIAISDTVGAGKSRQVGELMTEGLQAKAVYLSSDYRNPSNKSLEEIPEAVTGGGLILDGSKRTPNGNPYRRRAKESETSDIEALCPEDANIQRLRQKGTSVGRGENSPFCRGCHLFSGCEYLERVKQQKHEPILRSHINRFSPADGEDVVAFVDEAGSSIKSTQVLTANLHDLYRETERLREEDEDLYRALDPLLIRFDLGLSRAIAERDKFGVQHGDLVKFLPSKKEIDAVIFEAYWNKWMSAEDVWQLPSLRELAKKIEQLLRVKLTKEFQSRDTIGKQSFIDSRIMVGLLPSLLNIVDERSREDVAINAQGQIVLTKRSYQHGNELAKAKTAFYLDATPDLKDLARILSIPVTSLLQIECKRPTFENTTLKIIKGVGKAGSQRENFTEGALVQSVYSQQHRIEEAVKAIAQQKPNDRVGVLDYKKFIHRYEAIDDLTATLGYHFLDGRGSNRFEDCTDIIGIGAPTPNIGALMAEWHVLTGQTTQTSTFWAWVANKTLNELIQEIGRLRAQHRKGEKLTYWMLTVLSDAQKQAISDYYPGITLEEVDIYDLAPTAAPKGMQRERAILESIWQEVAAGEDPKISEIAQKIGVTRGRVSQIVKEAHPSGFKGLKQSLVLLSEALNSKTKLSDLSPEDWWFAKTYLPAIAVMLSPDKPATRHEALADFVSSFDAVGAAKFKQILAATPVHTLYKLLDAFLLMAPEDFQADLMKEARCC